MQYILTTKHISLSATQKQLIEHYAEKLGTYQRYLPHFLRITFSEGTKKPYYTSTLLCTLAKHQFSAHATANTVTAVIHKGFEKLLRMIHVAKEEKFHHQEQRTMVRTVAITI